MGDQKRPKSPKQYVSNLAVAALAGQAGLITLFIVVTAVIGGLWLDNIFQTKPALTIILVVASIPISVILMLVFVRGAVKRIQNNPDADDITGKQEDKKLGTGNEEDP